MPILLPNDRAAYVPIEKVACSSIKYALGTYLGIVEPKKWPHNWQWETATKAEIDGRSDLFRFAFVRNPFDRLLSCWANKVARYRDERPDCPLWPELSTSTPFHEFVAWATAQNPERCNWHFRPQCTFLDHGGQLVIDEIFRFEKIADEWACLQHYFGWPDLPHRNQSDHAADYRDAFTRPARAAAERFYRQDLDRLGYSFSF